MTLGRNTPDGKRLEGFITEIERVRLAKKELGEEEKAIFAGATAAGYSSTRIRDVLKIRTMKPNDRQEAEAQLEIYLHAIGMATETPLYRHVGLMKVDKAARTEVIEAFKLLVPTEGDIIVSMGGSKVRLWRDKDGEAHADDYVEPLLAEAPAFAQGASRPNADVPDVDDAGARALGRLAAKENTPVIANPFPFGDDRRPLWDEGWRDGAGSDGMGPDTTPKPDDGK